METQAGPAIGDLAAGDQSADPSVSSPTTPPNDLVDFPRFRGHLTSGPSGSGERMVFMPAPYPQEFREGAIRLVRDGRSVPEVARELGVSPQSLGTGSSTTSSTGVSAMTG